ncbi:MAG: DUF6879 family protein [Candidatus Dormibacteraceae bacterium]
MAEAPPAERHVYMDRETYLELREEIDTALANPYENFIHSAFRLETRQQYLVNLEAKAFASFKETGILPPWDQEVADWYTQVAESTKAGKTRSRVRIVDLPLTDYTRFEFEIYKDNIKAGEKINILDRHDHPELTELNEDFWLFDTETDHPTAVLIHYDDEGHYLDYWQTQNIPIIEECKSQRDRALAASVPFEEYCNSSLVRS